MVFPTASTIIFVKMGFTSVSLSARSQAAPSRFGRLLSIARAFGFSSKVTGSLALVVIVRVHSNPDDKADCDRYQYQHHDCF